MELIFLTIIFPKGEVTMERAPLFRAVSVIMAFVLLFSVFCNVKAYADNGNNSLSLTEEEKSYIVSHESLKVGYVTDRIPVSFQDDNGAAGITRYILDRISKIAGIEFEYVPLPSGEVTYDYLLSEGKQKCKRYSHKSAVFFKPQGGCCKG